MLPGIVLCSRLLKSASAVQAFNRYVRVKWWPTLENPWVEDSLDDDDLLKRKSVDYEVGKEEYVWVEKILKKNKIPFPEDIVNPTPSGWIPPNPELSKDVPYSVRRSKNHMLPVYYKEKQRKRKEHSHGTRQLTVIRHVDGDIHVRLWLMISGRSFNQNVRLGCFFVKRMK
uniref:Large ribosomal subunit protein mL49 n=1 Tax=Schistosoma japonicum TaxID=6182 RepID=C1LFJ9_SCHJA|nr:Mitochondrial 39S ribosomal protein L49 [Schistosoma japonicum]